ncbi:MAG: hypothetical protein HRT41_04190 [Campylobacteraceae bacterium]|nr:hypothetical protein [Campylobacteraceae bacterium]
MKINFIKLQSHYKIDKEVSTDIMISTISVFYKVNEKDYIIEVING